MNIEKICKYCFHAELTENLQGKWVYVCKVTDTENKGTDTCDNYYSCCSSCVYDGEQDDSLQCALCTHGSGYIED